MHHDGGARRRDGDVSSSNSAGVDLEATADEELQDRIVEAVGRAVEEAIQDHKRAGNPIAEWRDGRVVIVPPDEIED